MDISSSFNGELKLKVLQVICLFANFNFFNINSYLLSSAMGIFFGVQLILQWRP